MSRTISMGYLLLPIQALDLVGPMDIFQNITHSMISATVSKAEADQLNAPQVSFHYIGPSMLPVQMTGEIRVAPSCTVNDCPKLDYLLIGGSSPDYAENLPQEIKKFIQERSKEVKTIFTTCTGGLILAATGLLDGVEATTNHMFIEPFAYKISPSTKWEMQKHWVVSKKNGLTFWTAAGAGAGMDMMAEWIRTEFGQEFLDLSTAILEWQPRDINGKPVRYMNGRKEIVNGSA